jgi:hypothetical protein
LGNARSLRYAVVRGRVKRSWHGSGDAEADLKPTALAPNDGPTPWVPRLAFVRIRDSALDPCAAPGSFHADAHRAVNVYGLRESFCLRLYAEP